jgi:signal transduction histidine kinase
MRTCQRFHTLRPMNARNLHPIARINHVARTFGVAALIPLIGLVLHAQGRASLGLWALLLLWGLVWPQLAYALSRRSADAKRTEYRNLWADSLMVGAWAGTMHFSLWPTMALAMAMNLSAMSVAGPRVALWAGLGFALGMLGAGSVTGFALDLQTPPWPTAAGITSMMLVSSWLAYRCFVQGRLSVANRQLLREQKLQVEAQSAQLARARDEADAANRAKSLFLANMSHELRTPLNAIIGYCDLALEEAQEGDSAADLTADLRKIQSSGHHLLGLINDVLDISKIEAGQMTLHAEAVALAPLLEEVMNTVQPLALKNGNRLLLQVPAHTPLPATVHTDAGKVRQVLINLLGNAAKFTHQGLIELRVQDADAHRADQPPGLALAVVDTGIGLSPDQLARLFMPFSQADDSTTRRFGGTGLGLAVSRQLARLLGGDITVQSALGQGSTFTLHLPLGPA